MKKPDPPLQQILIRAAVEFSFAIGVTLSDSEISSPDARQKMPSQHRASCPLSYLKTTFGANSWQLNYMRNNEMESQKECLLTTVIVLVYFGDGHICPWRSHP
jgi:uncharacterized linocin/CFP29 family protein